MFTRPARFQTTAIADAGDLVAHEIDEDDLLAGSLPGRYRALCGELILPAPLEERPRAVCPGCAAARLHPELREQQDSSRVTRRRFAGVLRECVGITRCALQISGVAA